MEFREIMKAQKAKRKKLSLKTAKENSILREKLTQRAIHSEEDIKEGRVLNRTKIVRQSVKNKPFKIKAGKQRR